MTGFLQNLFFLFLIGDCPCSYSHECWLWNPCRLSHCGWFHFLLHPLQDRRENNESQWNKSHRVLWCGTLTPSPSWPWKPCHIDLINKLYRKHWTHHTWMTSHKCVLRGQCYQNYPLNLQTTGWNCLVKKQLKNH